MDSIAIVRKKNVPVQDPYAPKTSKDVLLDRLVVEDLDSWLREPGGGCGIALACVGAGLSTLVRLLVEELNFDAIWIVAGTKRAQDVLKDAGTFDVAPTGRRKLIVVDEFDPTDRFSSVVSDYFKSGTPVKLVCLAHSIRSTKPLEFASKWRTFAFPKASAEQIDAVLRKAGFVTDLRFEDGDVRSAFRLCISGHSRKDTFREGLDVVDAVLSGKGGSIGDVLREYAADPSVVSMGVFENYPTVSTLESAAKISDGFSIADTVDTAMYKTQLWELTNFHGASTVGVASTMLKNNGKKMRAEKFGTVWSRIYNSRSKRKTVAEINLRKMAHGETPLSVEDLAFQRQIVSHGGDPGCMSKTHVSLLTKLGNYKSKNAKK